MMTNEERAKRDAEIHANHEALTERDKQAFYAKYPEGEALGIFLNSYKGDVFVIHSLRQYFNKIGKLSPKQVALGIKLMNQYS